MGIFYGEGPEEKDFDMEIAFPVDQDVPSKGEFQCKELPGYDQMVTTIHKGGINSGGPAYAALGKWIEANGYYFGDTHSSSPPREFVTEIQLPIAKV